MARAIAGVLGTPRSHDGFLSAGGDLVAWARGHLIGLAEPEAYQPEWRRWSWSGLPMLPDTFRLAPLASGRAQLRVLASLVARRDVDHIVVATDADREGELIARWILRHLQARQPVRRLWLSETTPAAIRHALSTLQPASAYEALGQAAEARAQADWLVGLNATRAVTLRHGQRGQGALSVGRVQTPTLRLIADRDGEIAAFEAAPYWQVEVVFTLAGGGESTYRARWAVPGQTEPADRIQDQAIAEALVAKVPPGTPGTVRDRESRRIAIQPPKLYNLADLQKDANRRFGLTAADALGAAQRLYEARLSSYPRTDARAVSAAEAATMGERLAHLGPAYGDLVAALPSPLPLGRITSDAAVARAGHPAIVPTGERAPSTLSARDRQVWDLIVRRTLAALMPPGLDERTTLWTEAAGESFRTQGTVVVRPGWRVAAGRVPTDRGPDAGDELEGSIPAAAEPGQRVAVQASELLAKATKPPAHLTDASLLALMEKHGLGTPATRASILDTLVQRQYVAREQKALMSTGKGRALLKVAPEALQSPALTGEWEAQLEAIAQGGGDAERFLASIQRYVQDVVAASAAQAPTVISQDLGSCPVCREGHVRATKQGWGCSRWKEGCPLAIWRTVAQKRLTDHQVSLLLAGKTTGLLKGFKSKAGEPFSARLTLKEGRVAFVFGGARRAAPTSPGRTGPASRSSTRPRRSSSRKRASQSKASPP